MSTTQDPSTDQCPFGDGSDHCTLRAGHDQPHVRKDGELTYSLIPFTTPNTDPSTDQPCAYKSDLGKCTLSSGHGSIHLMPGRIKVAVLPKTADPINHPAHYTSSDARCECGKVIECIQVTETMDFCLGNATKYIWRAGLKGDAVEDLKKAAWYIERAIQQRTK